MYVLDLNTHMHVDFLPYPHHTCWYKYFMKGRGMGTLLIGVRYMCREMILGGHLARSYGEKWSINRGMGRTPSFGNTLFFFSFPTPKTPSLHFAAGQGQKKPAAQKFYPPFSSLTHLLSPSFPLTTHSLVPLY